MIISHKYKFIFIKTFKTAGTSIEVFLSQHCDDSDIVTPISPHVSPHVARNYLGLWNPLPEILMNRGRSVGKTLRSLRKKRKFYNHIPARVVRARVPRSNWENYFKFCVERNPWDKTLSHYYMLKHDAGGKMTLEEYLRKGNFCINYPVYTDKGDNLLVDRVIKYENLSAGLGEIFGRLGIPFEGSLGVSAKSEYRINRTPYHEIFSKEQKVLIERVFEKEILMHGYTY